jgi:hypothetical protein
MQNLALLAESRAQAEALVRAQAEAAHAAAIQKSREEMQATGATCDVAIIKTARRCDIPGAGRCGQCGRVFCQTHQSSKPVRVDQCRACQEAVAEAQRREAERMAEAQRRMEERRATAQREAEERRKRERAEHTHRVTKNEARHGGREAIVAKRTELRRLAGFQPSSFGTVVASAIVLYVVLMAIISSTLGAEDLDPNPALVYLPTAVVALGAPLIYWLTRNNIGLAKAEHSRQELALLRHASGCGEASCRICYPEKERPLWTERMHHGL